MIYIHLGALFVLMITVITSDLLGLWWVLGKRETLSQRTLMFLHWVVWTGLGVMIVSGVALALPLKDYLVQTPAFYIKMFFVFALIVNSFIIGSHISVATTKPFASLSADEKKPLLISGVVSGASWLGAFVAALFMSTSQWLLYFWSLLVQ